MSHDGIVVDINGNKLLDNGSKVAYEAIQGQSGHGGEEGLQYLEF